MILNPFPDFLQYSFVAPLLLRVLLGVIFLNFGILKLTRDAGAKSEFFEKLGMRPGKRFVLIFGVIETVAGCLLVIGLYTQIAALVAALVLLGTVMVKIKHANLLKSETSYYVVLLVISISLLLTGAGRYAIDVPL